MSDANKALAEVRGWLCDNLGSGDAGKVCGMLSVVSRRINELEAENIKLRAERDEWHRVAASKQDIIDHMRDARAENAKLRELVRAFWWCTENFDTPCKCDSCPLEQSDKLTPECEVRMRELGVTCE